MLGLLKLSQLFYCDTNCNSYHNVRSLDEKDTYMNENNQKQNNARVGNKPEWVGWSVD